jgi:hypothetical protein
MPRSHIRRIAQRRPHGCRVERRRHFAVVDHDGAYVATVAGTPKESEESVRNTLRPLALREGGVA